MKILPLQTTAPSAGPTAAARPPETPFADLLSSAARRNGTASAVSAGPARTAAPDNPDPDNPDPASGDRASQTAEAVAPPAAGGQHAFGFAALGVFGLHGALAETNASIGTVEGAVAPAGAALAAPGLSPTLAGSGPEAAGAEPGAAFSVGAPPGGEALELAPDTRH